MRHVTRYHLHSGALTVSNNPQDTIASYLTDMLALEDHLQKALAGQIADMKGSPFVTVITALKATSEGHGAALSALGARRAQGGSGLAGAVKRAASSVMGMGAAAIDLVRTESMPKNLRDNYTAVSLATIGYLMLYTTAETLNDNEAAILAHAHLTDYAKATMTLFSVVPDAVVTFLADEGFSTANDALSRVNERVEELWSSGASART